MHTEITAGEAEARFFGILEEVQEGQFFMITIEGRSVAQVDPFADAIAEAVERMRNPKITAISGDTMLEWIREGRK